jgi:hypothetical protein
MSASLSERVSRIGVHSEDAGHGGMMRFFTAFTTGAETIFTEGQLSRANGPTPPAT